MEYLAQSQLSNPIYLNIQYCEQVEIDNKKYQKVLYDSPVGNLQKFFLRIYHVFLKIINANREFVNSVYQTICTGFEKKVVYVLVEENETQSQIDEVFSDAVLSERFSNNSTICVPDSDLQMSAEEIKAKELRDQIVFTIRNAFDKNTPIEDICFLKSQLSDLKLDKILFKKFLVDQEVGPYLMIAKILIQAKSSGIYLKDVEGLSIERIKPELYCYMKDSSDRNLLNSLFLLKSKNLDIYNQLAIWAAVSKENENEVSRSLCNTLIAANSLCESFVEIIKTFLLNDLESLPPNEFIRLSCLFDFIKNYMPNAFHFLLSDQNLKPKISLFFEYGKQELDHFNTQEGDIEYIQKKKNHNPSRAKKVKEEYLPEEWISKTFSKSYLSSLDRKILRRHEILKEENGIDYYYFTHGQSTCLEPVNFLLRELFRQKHPDLEDNILFRHPDIFENDYDVPAIKESIAAGSDDWTLNRYLLSVDSYIHNTDSFESAEYFMRKNSNMHWKPDDHIKSLIRIHIKSATLVEMLFAEYMQKIYKTYNQSIGNKISIYIPKHLINEIGYSSKVFGVPAEVDEQDPESILRKQQMGKIDKKCVFMVKGKQYNFQYRLLTNKLYKYQTDPNKKNRVFSFIDRMNSKDRRDFKIPIREFAKKILRLQALEQGLKENGVNPQLIHRSVFCSLLGIPNRLVTKEGRTKTFDCLPFYLLFGRTAAQDWS